MTNIPSLDEKELRKFGLMTGAIIVALFAFFFPWVFNMTSMPMWPWILAGLLWLPALLMPSVLRPVYTTWMKIGHGIGWVNTRIIIGLLFWISAGILYESAWNIFLNPYDVPNNMSETIWENVSTNNRLYLMAGTIISMLLGLFNLQNREKFI